MTVPTRAPTRAFAIFDYLGLKRGVCAAKPLSPGTLLLPPPTRAFVCGGACKLPRDGWSEGATELQCATYSRAPFPAVSPRRTAKAP